jgi:hypothetical protein
MYEQFIKIIDRRIDELKKDLSKLPSLVKPKKKIHPANKQLHGRIKELKYIKKEIINIIKKSEK